MEKPFEIGDTIYYVNDGYVGSPFVGDSNIIAVDGDEITYNHYYGSSAYNITRVTKAKSSKLFATELEAYKHLAELLKDSIKDLKQEFKEQLSELEERNSELQHEVNELIDKVNELERE